MGFCMYEFFRDPMVHLGTATRVCFVKFKDPSSVHVAQHLTNTVFIDRALIVVPVQDGEFIEREYQNIVLIWNVNTPSSSPPPLINQGSLPPPPLIFLWLCSLTVKMFWWSFGLLPVYSDLGIKELPQLNSVLFLDQFIVKGSESSILIIILMFGKLSSPHTKDIFNLSFLFFRLLFSYVYMYPCQNLTKVSYDTTTFSYNYFPFISGFMCCTLLGLIENLSLQSASEWQILKGFHVVFLSPVSLSSIIWAAEKTLGWHHRVYAFRK